MAAKAVKGGILVSILVKPSSGTERLIFSSDEILIEIKEPPERNRANLATIRVLSKSLGVSSRNISIVRGHSDRLKSIFIVGMNLQDFTRIITSAENKKSNPK